MKRAKANFVEALFEPLNEIVIKIRLLVALFIRQYLDIPFLGDL
jgi:hypothetical protein